MRYYNEAKAERSIRRQASWITLLIFAFMLSGMTILLSEQPEDLIPEPVKEWLNIESEKVETPKKRA